MNSIVHLPIVCCLLLAAGCGTTNTNPSAPRPGNGYVDFYTDSDLHLSWQIRRADPETGKLKTLFSEFKPVEGNILRLAAPPGTRQYEVWFSNQVTTGPQAVTVEVVDGSVTPVHVTLTPAGSASVQSQSYEYRPTARATRRVTRTSSAPQQGFQIEAVAGAARSYQPREHMPYFASPTK